MSNDKNKIKVSDRVKRINLPGSCGTVKELREEVTGTTGTANGKAMMVAVLWDNGTFSYFSPESLEIVS